MRVRCSASAEPPKTAAQSGDSGGLMAAITNFSKGKLKPAGERPIKKPKPDNMMSAISTKLQERRQKISGDFTSLDSSNKRDSRSGCGDPMSYIAQSLPYTPQEPNEISDNDEEWDE